MLVLFFYNIYIMIWSKEYINMYTSVKKKFHIKNIEIISKDKIKYISRSYDNELFEHYKKQLFFKWLFINSQNTISFFDKVRKIIKKLEIELNDYESEKLLGIIPREFTSNRKLKTLEVPYKSISSSSMFLQPYAYFFYKKVKVYQKSIFLFKKLFEGEIYMTSREIVFYDRKNNQIQKIIKTEPGGKKTDSIKRQRLTPNRQTEIETKTDSKRHRGIQKQKKDRGNT